jgi:hypothetical protein
VNNVLKIPFLIPLQQYEGVGVGVEGHVKYWTDWPFHFLATRTWHVAFRRYKRKKRTREDITEHIFLCETSITLKNQDRDSSVSTLHRLQIPGTAYRPALEHMKPPSIVSNQHRGSWPRRTTDHSVPSSAQFANKQIITGTKTSGVNIPGSNTEGLTKNAMHSISSLNGWQLLSGPRTSQLQYKPPSRPVSP